VEHIKEEQSNLLITIGHIMERKTKELIRELEERLEALVIAIPKEIAAHKFYLDLANSSQHEGARKMFLELADQEFGHKQSLEKVVKEIQNEIAELKAGMK
jgi:rubrerythrin